MWSTFKQDAPKGFGVDCDPNETLVWVSPSRSWLAGLVAQQKEITAQLRRVG